MSLAGFKILTIIDSSFLNIMTSSSLLQISDEYFADDKIKMTKLQNVTFINNTLIMIDESSLLYMNYYDSHEVNFTQLAFHNNTLLLAMDRVNNNNNNEISKIYFLTLSFSFFSSPTSGSWLYSSVREFQRVQLQIHHE